METVSNNKNKILAVDDNPKNIQVIGSILRDAGYSVGFANNGQQALDLLNKVQDFDLVLLDINMPVMSGLDTCRAMRKDEKMKEIPVVFLTALNDPENVVEGFDAGGQDYVAKPFNSKEVLSRVKTHIDLKKSKDQLKKTNQWLEVKVQERTAELQKANQELEVLDKAKSDFLSIISHQINTPLNGVLGFITVLKEELADPRLKEMLHYLELSANRLDRFAKLSLKITELRTNKNAIEKTGVNLDDIVKSSKAILLEQINKKNISIIIEGCLNETILNGAPELIEFCFESILDNAIDHSPIGGIIRLKIESYKEKTICSFVDEGEGFTEQTLKNLFQLFIPNSQYSDENNGLDLALVKLIMDTHNGEIKAYNNKEKGATVIVTFPN